MKYWKTKEFKALNAKWQEKLEAKGFEDIENKNGNLKDFGPRRDLVSTQNAFTIRDFFMKVDAFLADERTKIPKKHRKILTLYTNGDHLVDVAKSVGLSLRTVFRVIDQYKTQILQQ